MEQFPILESERLILNKLEHTDIPKIVVYAGNPNITRYTLNIPHPYYVEDAIYWINSAVQGFKTKSQYTFAIRLKSTREFIGGIGLILNKRHNRATLGYWVAEPFWNYGYVTEATKVVLAFGFKTLKLNKILATYLKENPASGKVMVKNGMIKEGELKDHYKKDSLYQSVIQYRLTKEEFENL